MTYNGSCPRCGLPSGNSSVTCGSCLKQYKQGFVEQLATDPTIRAAVLDSLTNNEKRVTRDEKRNDPLSALREARDKAAVEFAKFCDDPDGWDADIYPIERALIDNYRAAVKALEEAEAQLKREAGQEA
jgi:hypothetical protein